MRELTHFDVRVDCLRPAILHERVHAVAADDDSDVFLQREADRVTA
jgi:hypothetical protein